MSLSSNSIKFYFSTYLPNLQSFEIGKGCFRQFCKDLVFDNFPNLENITVKEKSLQDLNSLKICNCEKLKTIGLKDNTCGNVDNMIFDSISEVIIFIFISS